MPKKPAEVTETELAILDILWDGGQTDIREIVESLYHKHTRGLHATVKSLLERLAAKGYVKCDRSRFAYRYSAAIDRETYVGQQLEQLAASHFGGSHTPMLLALVDRAKLSKRDRESIRKIIEGME
jgi:predicted transcriptional regulator